MKQNYPTAIDFIFKFEGGYVNHPQDPGGPTNRGITLATARSFWKSDATAEDIKNMPKSVAENIYQKQYADKIGFDTLPSGIDLVCFDAAVLSGPGRAKTWLKDSTTIAEYQAKRLAFYKSLKIWPTFGKGWTSRLNAGTKLANSLPKTDLSLSPSRSEVKVPEPAKPALKVTPAEVGKDAAKTGGIITTGTGLGVITFNWPIIGLAVFVGIVGIYILYKYFQYKRMKK